MRRVPVLTVAVLAALALAPVVQAQVGNIPNADDNNRVVGMDGGNIFYNAIVPGSSVSSNMALTGLAMGGGSPNGGTGAAGLVATIADVDMNIAAEGGDSVSANGLTVSVGADGSYELATTADYSGTWIVTIGDTTGQGVHLVAAAAAMVPLDSSIAALAPGTFDQAGISYAGGVATVAADPNSGVLGLALGSVVEVEAGSWVSVILAYESNSADVSVAAIGFDGAGPANNQSYFNAAAGNTTNGVMKYVATSFISQSGNVIAGFQVFNSGAAAASVEVSELKVVMAGPPTAYAVGAADVAVPAFGTWSGNLLQAAGVVGGVVEGNAITLTGIGNTAANSYTSIAADTGELAVEANLSVSETSDTGTLALYVTDGGGFTAASFTPAVVGDVSLGTSGTASAPVATMFVLLQASGANASLTEVSATEIADGEAFSSELLGL